MLYVRTYPQIGAEPKPVSRTKYFAHSGDTFDQSNWHALHAHLHGTAAKAADSLRATGFQDFGRVAGLLHDLGKYTSRFQRLLAGDTGRVDHSTAGAQIAVERFGPVVGRMLAFCIAGHHAGTSERRERRADQLTG